jgi:hypothetical protein
MGAHDGGRTPVVGPVSTDPAFAGRFFELNFGWPILVYYPSKTVGVGPVQCQMLESGWNTPASQAARAYSSPRPKGTGRRLSSPYRGTDPRQAAPERIFTASLIVSLSPGTFLNPAVTTA